MKTKYVLFLFICHNAKSLENLKKSTIKEKNDHEISYTVEI